MKLLFAAALLGALAVASASCPNLCSQHGTCGENDRCTCFSNWQGADCSERVCPYGLAWVDAPSGTNKAHWYAECSNKGVCNRETGQCECHAGYEGKGCKRSSCPNDCSGHGTCYFIEQLKDLNGKMVVDYGNWKTGRNDKTWYDLWDKSKIQGCVCDPYYEGTDCSLRQCPRGDNVLTTGSRTSAGVTEAKDQGNTHQEILITQGGADTANEKPMQGEITLTYTDLYGGVWETDPIMLNPVNSDDQDAAWTGGSPAYIASRIQAELENLPNQVVESVTVTNLPCGLGLGSSISVTACASDAPSSSDYVCVGPAAGSHEVRDSLVSGSYLGFSSTFLASSDFGSTYLIESGESDLITTISATGFYAIRGQCLNFRVEFTSAHNAGQQELLQVNYKGCNYDGCAPQYTGITDEDIDGTEGKRLTVIVEDVTEYVNSGSTNKLMHREKAICSEHGLCDTTTGLCNCFSGYFDEDCHQQTVLV